MFTNKRLFTTINLQYPLKYVSAILEKFAPFNYISQHISVAYDTAYQLYTYVNQAQSLYQLRSLMQKQYHHLNPIQTNLLG